MSVFVSSGAFGSVRTVDELLPLCREQGVKRVELASGLGANAESLAALGATDSDDFSFLLHNYFPAPDLPFVLNLADRDEPNRLRSIEFCRSALQLSAGIGAPFYSVHAGFVATLRPEDLGKPERQNFTVSESDYSEGMERFTESVEELDRTASRLGIRLLLENNVDGVGSPERSHLLLVSGEDITLFFANNSFESVGLLMDVAHLAVSATHRGFSATKALEDSGPWVEALHLSDNDGSRDTNECCTDGSWFWEPLTQSINPGIPAVLEAYRLSATQIDEQVALIESRLSFTSATYR